MVRLALLLAFLAGVGVTMAAADDRATADLARARQLYNMRDFAGAVTAAEAARTAPERTDSANLISARALLERFRESASPDDLTSARERLRSLSPERLADGERLEYVVGLGETLYFEDAPGAAAQVFESVLDTQPALLVDGRDRVLDWWASAVESQARSRPEVERQALYRGVRTRMRKELATRPVSTTAAYWVVAAARGQGDLQGAWDAACAAWARATLAPDHGAELRGDLDRLVMRAVIPERARTTNQAPATLLQEWAAFKERWNR